MTLEQNYPNPFNPATKIAFSLTGAGQVMLEIYGLTGRRVATLIDGAVEAGTYAAEWVGRSDVAPP